MRLEGHIRSGFVVSSALALTLAAAASARASSVTVTGGFTAFNGLASGIATNCVSGIKAFVAGELVNASSCTLPPAPPPPARPPTQGISGPATYVFPSTMSSFEFFEQGLTGGVFVDEAHNGFSFTSAGPQTPNAINGVFLFGTFSFTNGTWFGTGPVNFFHIELTTHSTDGALDGRTLSDDLVLDIRVGNTAVENGDCFSLVHFNLGQVCAFEPGVPGQTNTVTAQLWGRIGSLIPTEFTNVTGGFLIPPTTTAVPEPMSLILVGTGLAAIVRRRRRAR